VSEPNETLYAEIHRDHLGVVARTAHAFAVERSDREELFQEILVQLWQALPQFNRASKLSTYVYRVALNCALNWKRSRRRYQLKLEAYGAVLAEPEGRSPVERDRLRWLYARIHELPTIDRTLILLFLDQVSYSEIADITGLSESNVGVRLHRIKQQLAAQSQQIER
jgi:RNA polymerase sigma-70 factor, ECF subfamily